MTTKIVSPALEGKPKLNGNLKFSFLPLSSLFTALICTILCTQYFSDPLSEDLVGSSILFGYSYALGHFFLLVFGATLVFAIVPLLLKRKKTVFLLVVVLDALMLAYVVADIIVWSQFRAHVNLGMLQMAFFGKGQIVPFSWSDLGEIVLLLSLCCVGSIGLSVLAKKLKVSKLVHSLIIALPLGLFVVTNITYGWSYAKQNLDVLMAASFIPGSSPLTFNNFLIKHGLLSRQEIRQINLDKSIPKTQIMRYPLNPLVCSGNSKEYNLVILVVDSLRYDELTPEIMPNSWKFAQSAIKFNDHWSGGNGTQPGLFALFYGIPASYWNAALYSETPSILIQALEQRNYEIGAFASATLSLPEFDETIFSGVRNLRVDSEGDDSLERDLDAENDFKKWVNAIPQGKKFFGFIFLDNVHDSNFPENPEHIVFKPYLDDLDFLELTDDTDPIPLLNRNKNAARYADIAVGRIIDFLKEKKLLSSTVVILTSDHGNEYNDNGQNYWNHNGNFTKFQVKVPLVVWWPGKRPCVIEHRTSGLDIVPTLLPDLLGCSNPTSDYSSGNSLWVDAKRSFIYSSSPNKEAYIEPNRTVIFHHNGYLYFVDNRNKKSKDTSYPAYLSTAIKEKSRFLKE